MKQIILRLYTFFLTPRWAALAITAASVGSLGTAYIAQNFFGVEPCILCIYQRIPYALNGLVGLAAYALRDRDVLARRLIAFAALAFIVNSGIAFFHSGVELHWWAGTDTCAIDPAALKAAGASAASMREALLKTPTVRCDEVNFTFLGFTMANWNVLASLGLGVYAFMASFLGKKKR